MSAPHGQRRNFTLKTALWRNWIPGCHVVLAPRFRVYRTQPSSRPSRRPGDRGVARRDRRRNSSYLGLVLAPAPQQERKRAQQKQGREQSPGPKHLSDEPSHAAALNPTPIEG